MKTRDPRIAALSLGARYLLEAVEELATNGVVTATATMTLAATLSLAVCAPPAQVDPALKELVEYKLVTVEAGTLTLQVSQQLSLKVSHQRGQLSLVDAARRLGIGRSTLYRYLNGEVAWPADLLAKWEGATPGTTSGTLGGTVSGTRVPASPSLPSPSPSSPSSPSHTLPLTPPPATPLSQPSPEGEGARTRKKTKTDTTDVLLDPGSLAAKVSKTIQGCAILGPVTVRPNEFALAITQPDAYPGIDVVAAVLACETWCQTSGRDTKNGRARIANRLKNEVLYRAQRPQPQQPQPKTHASHRDDPSWVPPEAPVLAEIRARRAALQAQREAKAS